MWRAGTELAVLLLDGVGRQGVALLPRSFGSFESLASASPAALNPALTARTSAEAASCPHSAVNRHAAESCLMGPVTRRSSFQSAEWTEPHFSCTQPST